MVSLKARIHNNIIKSIAVKQNGMLIFSSPFCYY